MSSVIVVDTIKDLDGDICFVEGYPRKPGQVIEYLTNICDGTSATVLSNTYSFANVSNQFITSTVYQDISGSSIIYQPPPGASIVLYQFHFSVYSVTTHDINHFKFFIGSDEVVNARHNRSGQYNEQRYTFEWPIKIGGTANANAGILASWTSPLELKMQTRRYGNSNYQNLHGTRYWDGGASNQNNTPVLSIIAIA